MTRAIVFALASLCSVAVARTARAQQPGGRCILELENTANTRLASQKVPNTDFTNLFAGGVVVAHCAGQDVTLRADSAEYYSGQQTLYLIGSVNYTEPRVRVNAQRMTYFQSEERLLAVGDVDAVLPTGTTMRGPQAEYFRDIPGVRPRARLVAPGRPQFRIVQPDSSGRPPEPTALVADRVATDGDNLVYASGRVEIDRTDVSARGDSAFLDSQQEFARLMRGPSIQGKGARPFTLRGRVVDLFSRQRQLQRVLAAADAEALSDDLRLTSDTIDMRLAAGQLDRAYAWGRSRARVTSPDRDIVADSLDVRLPGQRVREVRALRGAYAATAPDTTRFRSTERDWLRGDTIVARFDSAAPRSRARGDSAARPQMRELQAIGNARSFYQLAPQRRDPAGRPSVNYVVGRLITVALNGSGVQTVTVLDRANGVYLEPADAGVARGVSGSATPGAVPATRPAAQPGTRSGADGPTRRPTTAAPAARVRPTAPPTRVRP